MPGRPASSQAWWSLPETQASSRTRSAAPCPASSAVSRGGGAALSSSSGVARLAIPPACHSLDAMSKESDAPDDESDTPPPGGKNYMTPRGLRALEDEL